MEHNRVMNRIFIIFFLSTLSIQASSKTFKVEIGPKSMDLELQGQALLFSPSKKSQALQAISKGINLTRQEVSGLNPGSVACKKLKGKVVLGKLWNGHSQSFCFFQDKSLVSCQGIKLKIAEP